MIDPLYLKSAALGTSSTTTRLTPANGSSSLFAQTLESAVRDAKGVRFSAHALDRIRSRNLNVTPADEAKIGQAIDAAAAKGSRESLLLTDRYALVVSVPNRTVITATPRSELADSVFTNIDSAVVLAS